MNRFRIDLKRFKTTSSPMVSDCFWAIGERHENFGVFGPRILGRSFENRTRFLLQRQGMMGDGIVGLKKYRAWIENAGLAGFPESGAEIFPDRWRKRPGKFAEPSHE
jgi:hypothetical protein